MADKSDPKGDAEMRSRLDSLKAAIDKSASTEKVSMGGRQAEGTEGQKGIAAGLRVMSELVAGVLVGAAMGYGLDWLFGTRPWLFLIFLMLGFAAGFRNVYRLGMAPTGASKRDIK